MNVVRLYCAALLVWMIGLTAYASMTESVTSAFGRLMRDRWGAATLADAYSMFILFWLWQAWRERTWLSRGLWFVAMLLTGSLGAAVYVLWASFRLGRDGVPRSVKGLVLGRHAASEVAP